MNLIKKILKGKKEESEKFQNNIKQFNKEKETNKFTIGICIAMNAHLHITCQTQENKIKIRKN